MARKSKAIADFQAKYKVAEDELWEVHGSTWCIKHKALERIAAEQNITWDRPAMLECNSVDGVAAMCVFGKLGERMEWSIGEALVARQDRIGGNYKVTGKQAGYVYAMAEKRAKDRVILKLLEAHGDLYSEEEADDFKQSRKGTPDGYLDDGETIPAEHTIKRDDGIQVLTMDAQRPIFSELEKELNNCATVDECKRWVVSAKSRASRLSGHWKDDLNKRYLTHLRSIEKRDADEYIERKQA